jgi:hypothetical protein
VCSVEIATSIIADVVRASRLDGSKCDERGKRSKRE